VTIRQDPYHPISRETADHSMPYIVGAAVLDGYIQVDSFDLDRVLAPDRQKFVAEKVKVTPEPALGTIASGKLARAAAGYLSRVEIELEDGTVVHGEAKPFPGHPKAPFTEADIAQKVSVNATQFAGQELTDRIIAMLGRFEQLKSVREFTGLLAFEWKAAKVSAAA
jgi:2-methylcitrate dehydratase